MSRYEKIRAKIMSGKSDACVSKDEIELFLTMIGAKHKRTKESHYQYGIEGITEQLNLQFPCGKAKPYQVKQIRNIVNKYKLGKEE